jgi:hypothetical protein
LPEKGGDKQNNNNADNVTMKVNALEESRGKILHEERKSFLVGIGRSSVSQDGRLLKVATS